MNAQRLLAMVGMICLLVGASGPGMAQTLTDCGDGSISGGTFDGIRLTEYEDCVLVGVSVGSGGVVVRNARVFTMINSYVGNGSIRVLRDDKSLNPSAATILNNVVKGGDIVIKELIEADVRRNTVEGGDIRVIDDPALPNQFAEVLENRIKGNLRVNDNLTADVKGNTVIKGNITCKGNLNTDTNDNDAVAGRIVCSQDLLPGQ